MGRIGGKAGSAAHWAAASALLLALPGAGTAQSVSDYQLPRPQQTDSRAQGPVDESVPIIVPVRPSPTPAATQPAPASGAATPAAQPGAATPAPRTAASPRPQAGTAAPRAQSAAPPAAGGAQPAAQPQPQPGTVPASVPSLGLPAPAASGAAPLPLPPAGQTAPAAVPASALPGWWPYAALALALLALAAGFAIGRRRGAAPVVVAFERPVVATPAPQPAAPVPPEAEPSPAPLAAVPQRPLSLTLEATRLSASLMATTLNYRLRLTNHTAEPLSTLAIEGDMIAAHGSLPPEQQVLQAGQRLDLRHAVMALAPGESTELQGELRLPLTAINPIRAGEAALFIPLARFRVEAASEGARPLELTETFVVGEVTPGDSATLRPFRLDLGPRTYSRIGQRAVA